MTTRSKHTRFLVAFLVLAAPLAVYGQDPFGANPFGSAPATTAVEPAPAAAQPPAEEKDPDPVVQEIRDMRLSRPDQLVWAVQTVLRINRPDEARRYLNQLLETNPSSEILVQLHERFRSALFLELVRRSDIQPEGKTLGEAVLKAAHEAFRDPDRLAGFVKDLGSSDPAVRRAALVDLKRGGSAAIVVLIGVLADGERAAEHAAVRDALVRLGPASIEPLVAALQSGDSSLRTQAIAALARLQARQAVLWLLRPALADGVPEREQAAARIALERFSGVLPKREEAIEFLAQRIRAHLDGTAKLDTDPEGRVRLWLWDVDGKRCTEQLLESRMATLTMAGLLGEELAALAPKDHQYRRLRLIALLGMAKAKAGLEQPLTSESGAAWDKASAAGASMVTDVLAEAMRRGDLEAAIGAAEVLAEIGDTTLLVGREGRPSVIVKAAEHPDPRLRFAAVQAIMKWDPKMSYAGSSYVLDALAHFARSSGERRVLIGQQQTEKAQTLVGMLSELGFVADTALTGNDVFRQATADPDYEFLLVSDGIVSPPTKELIQQLRREPRTSRLPIGIMARKANYQDMEDFAAQDPLTLVFPRVADVSGLVFEVRNLTALRGADSDEGDQRIRRALVALDHLARLAEKSDEYTFYDLLAHEQAVTEALMVGPLATRAAGVLGWLGTPTAQTTLVETASQNTRPLAHRQAAAAAFALAVTRRGLRLSRDQILRQYDRYNRSAVLDRATQQVLGKILDAIEAPSKNQP